MDADIYSIQYRIVWCVKYRYKIISDDIETYKVKWYGKRIVKIDKFYSSSQFCNGCGYVNKETKNLSIREWVCPVCRVKHAYE